MYSPWFPIIECSPSRVGWYETEYTQETRLAPAHRLTGCFRRHWNGTRWSFAVHVNSSDAGVEHMLNREGYHPSEMPSLSWRGLTEQRHS
jgi:hypothetical protein